MRIGAIMAVASAAIISVASATAPKTEQLYPTAGIVTALHEETDSFTVKTYSDEYTLTDIDDWWVGDEVAMIMSDNGTQKITDDYVIDYRYVVVPRE